MVYCVFLFDEMGEYDADHGRRQRAVQGTVAEQGAGPFPGARCIEPEARLMRAVRQDELCPHVHLHARRLDIRLQRVERRKLVLCGEHKPPAVPLRHDGSCSTRTLLTQPPVRGL